MPVPPDDRPRPGTERPAGATARLGVGAIVRRDRRRRPPRDGIGDDDGIGIARWPPVGTHVDDCRGQRVVKQHVPAEVSMNQLAREIDGSPTSKQPLHRLRKLGVDLPPGHPVGDGPSMRRHDRRGPCDARDSSVEVLRCIENLVPHSVGVVPVHPLPCHPARDNPVSGHRTDGLDDADGRSRVPKRRAPQPATRLAPTLPLASAPVHRPGTTPLGRLREAGAPRPPMPPAPPAEAPLPASCSWQTMVSLARPVRRRPRSRRAAGTAGSTDRPPRGSAGDR